MKGNGIIRNAVTSNLPRELAYRVPAASDQRGTYVAELLAIGSRMDKSSATPKWRRARLSWLSS